LARSADIAQRGLVDVQDDRELAAACEPSGEIVTRLRHHRGDIGGVAPGVHVLAAWRLASTRLGSPAVEAGGGAPATVQPAPRAISPMTAARRAVTASHRPGATST